jgi:hypothetical protein
LRQTAWTTLYNKSQSQINGSLSGWDRIVFRGFLRTLAYVPGMAGYLQRIGCLLKNFGDHVEMQTEKLLAASLQRAEQTQRPVKYIDHPLQEKRTLHEKLLKPTASMKDSSPS